MTDIDPSALKRLRSGKSWSQDDLAERTRINKQTISRLECGKGGKPRRHTIERLCEALNVTPAQLAGDAPPTRPSIFDTRSLLSLRVENRARNALTLVAIRYGLAPSRIVEIAPFLFVWAAEKSLRQREGHLAQLNDRLDAVWELRNSFPHVPDLVTFYPNADDMEPEERSIASNDIFARIVDEQDWSMTRLAGGGEQESYDPAENNPFVRFLQTLAADLGETASFDRWDTFNGPEYQVCDDLAEKIAGDPLLGEEIVDGRLPLHEMPKEFSKEGREAESAQWIREQSALKRRELDDEFERLGLSDEPSHTTPGEPS